ncbi:MAG: type II secretion system F family protein, partial [Gemmatimonadota bacterium]
MPTFTYSARSVTGEMHTGEIDVKDRDEVMGYLRKQRMVPLKVAEKQKGFELPSFGTGITTRDIVIFTRQFATMINSGLPLVQSLDILARQSENKSLRKTIEQVLYDVESGQTLADAMREHLKVFPELYVNMVAAGEAGGILDTILLRLAVFLEKADALKRKIKGAMVYPAVIMTVAFGAVAVLLIFVIPTFQEMFESAGVPLPGPTQFVIFLSETLQARWYVFVITAAMIVVALRQYYRTPGGQLVLDRLLLNLPVFGNLQRKTAIARFTRTLGT